MNLVVVGVNFRTAPIELREKLVLHASAVRETLRKAAGAFPGLECVILSTCNRTEIYAAGPGLPSPEDLVAFLTGALECGDGPQWREHFYVREGTLVVDHLMSVAASLDSMVVGETEILSQVKQAYMISVEASATGALLNPLFQGAFKAAKRVHTETDICRGRVSVSSIAVDFAEKIFEDLASKTVMIIGAGEMSELTLKSLVDRGVADIMVLNRSLEKAEELADKHGGRAVEFDLLDESLPAADIVISSTSAPHCIIRVDSMRKSVAERHGRPVFIVDIAVPRNVEEAVGTLENVYLYNIDDLQEIASENLSRREGILDAARRIVAEEAARLEMSWHISTLGSVMKALDMAAAEARDEELSRGLSRKKLASLDEESREEIRLIVHRAVNRILASPRKALREAAEDGRWEEYSHITRHLFGIEDDGDDSRDTSPGPEGED